MGEMYCPLTGKQLRELFPTVKGAESLDMRDTVDFMIGMDQPGLQPVRKTKLEEGGELYLWMNRFGRCIGGRHSWIASAPKKKTMFTVVTTLF